MLIARDSFLQEQGLGAGSFGLDDLLGPRSDETCNAIAGWSMWPPRGPGLVRISGPGDAAREPKAMELVCTTGPSRLRLQPDSFALGPTYVLRSAQGVEAVSDDPALLGAIAGSDLDAVAMFEDLEFGFRVGRRTIFTGVERLMPGEWVEVLADPARGPCAASVQFTDPAGSRRWSMSPGDAVQALAQDVASAFAAGFALELSGGIDTRLILALGLSAGRRPDFAFTLGDDRTSDVITARTICEQFGIPHHAILPEFDPDALPDDAAEFVENSGFAVNASAFGWLPAAFRRLSPLRKGQVSGVGGECAGGFYYSPFDGYVESLGLKDAWIRYRLCLPGNSARRVFTAGAYEAARSKAFAEVRESLDRGEGSWRDRTDRFYREQRIRLGAGAVLTASSHWYDVAVPFLDGAYMAWANSKRGGTKTGRQAQVDLVAELCPKLAGASSAGDAGPDSRLRLNGVKTVKKAKGMLRRLGGWRHAPDLGASSAARVLAGDRRFRGQLAAFVADRSLGLDEAGCIGLVDDSGNEPHEVGFLACASLAQSRLRTLTKRIRGPAIHQPERA